MSLRVSFVVCAVALVGCSSAPSNPAPQAIEAAFAPSTMRADGIERLLAGNARFVSGHAHGEGRDAARRAEVAKGQHPYAIVITCSDSRVSPEIVFDAGIGELFVIRTAGHVIDDHALGSIEYAAEHLHTKTVLVLGHERCGAVGAAMQGGEQAGHIGSLVTAIEPYIKNVNHGNDATAACVKANVLATTNALRHNQPLLAELCEKHGLDIRGGYYDLDTGAVEVLDEPAATPR
jgi:carbonic anhydrase